MFSFSESETFELHRSRDVLRCGSFFPMTAGLETQGRYELRLRGGAEVVESGNFKVECLVRCSGD